MAKLVSGNLGPSEAGGFRGAGRWWARGLGEGLSVLNNSPKEGYDEEKMNDELEKEKRGRVVKCYNLKITRKRFDIEY